VGHDWLASWRPVVHSWEAWVFCVVLCVLVPFHGVLAYGRLESTSEPIPTKTKLRLYVTIVAMEWTLVAVAAAIAHSRGLTLGHLGQTLANPRLTLAVTAFGLVALLALTLFNARQVRSAPREDLEATVEKARKFVPVGRAQIAGFVFVAFTAGICEEILYRGWLVNFLGALFGSIWIGVIVAAILFGVGHAYQGRQGMIATGSLGLIFGSMYIWIRSLVPGEVLHAGIDLVNGILAGRVVERLGPEPGAEGPTGSAEPEGDDGAGGNDGAGGGTGTNDPQTPTSA
jgi:membrane protease YdiL (CAAX protease family)